ncbi:MAG: hypothetical protein Kow0025_00040 [Thermodesulfovibrionales bacterium]
MAGEGYFRFDLGADLENAVREGAKTLDVRVNSEPFADVNVGDVIAFRSARARVTGIRPYPCLHDVVGYEDFRKLVPAAADRGEAHRRLKKDIPGEEPPHGLLVFEIELVRGGFARHERAHLTKKERRKAHMAPGGKKP